MPWVSIPDWAENTDVYSEALRSAIDRKIAQLFVSGQTGTETLVPVEKVLRPADVEIGMVMYANEDNSMFRVLSTPRRGGKWRAVGIVDRFEEGNSVAVLRTAGSTPSGSNSR
jgi:hypothetical protein